MGFVSFFLIASPRFPSENGTWIFYKITYRIRDRLSPLSRRRGYRTCIKHRYGVQFVPYELMINRAVTRAAAARFISRLATGGEISWITDHVHGPIFEIDSRPYPANSSGRSLASPSEIYAPPLRRAPHVRWAPSCIYNGANGQTVSGYRR